MHAPTPSADPRRQAAARLCALLFDTPGAAAGTPIAPAEAEALVELAQAHGLAILLERRLAAAAGFPEAARARLKRLALAGAARATWLAQALPDLLATLAAADCRPLPFKGPDLALRAHGDESLRPCEDLDILVSADRLGAARAALMARGFTPALALTEREQAAHDRAGWGCVLRSPGHEFMVELSCRVLPAYFGCRWTRADLADAPGARRPESAAELTALALHAAKHGWSRLLWLADLAALWRAADPATRARATRQAERIGAGRILAVNGHLLARLCGVTGMARAGDRQAEAIAARVIGRLLDGATGDAAERDTLALWFRLLERPGDRARFLWRLLSTPSYSDRRWVRLPAWADAGYYVLRPLRLLLGRRPPHG